MKNLLFFFAFSLSVAQAQVASIVYDYDSPSETVVDVKAETRTFFKDSSRDFETMQMDALLFKKRGNFKLKSDDLEQLVIVKKGEVGFSISKSNRIMGPGSIALLMPGDKLKLLVNPGDEVYVMKYKAQEGQSPSRGKENGGSFLKDWDEQSYKTHDKGGIRNFYNQPTAACQRMEMHVSNLNPGIKSHEPHTHRAAEIVLMIKGKSEMELDGKIVHGDAGDIYFLGSEVPHAIKNIDSEQIQYFAYQFE